jgi:hypothetical protein
MLIIIALIGFILVLLSFATWSRPSILRLTEAPDSYKWARGIALGLWTLALPVYWLVEWYIPLKQHLPATDVPSFQYAHQLWSSVWAAVAGLLAVLFGIRK